MEINLDWFKYLSPTWRILIPVLFLVAILLIAFFTKSGVKLGKFKLGGSGKIRRSCGDCVLLLMGKREKLEQQYSRLEDEKNRLINSILKDQMNFAEQKLIEIQALLLNAYSEELIKKRSKTEYDYVEESNQSKLYYGLLRDTLWSVKDEVRRSFKENHFATLDEFEFTRYVRDKVTAIMSQSIQHMTNLYPQSKMIITLNDRVMLVEKFRSKFEDFSVEVYMQAREIKKQVDKKIEEIERRKDAAENVFKEEIDNFIYQKN